jgi:hypothetical protein
LRVDLLEAGAAHERRTDDHDCNGYENPDEWTTKNFFQVHRLRLSNASDN